MGSEELRTPQGRAPVTGQEHNLTKMESSNSLDHLLGPHFRDGKAEAQRGEDHTALGQTSGT